MLNLIETEISARRDFEEGSGESNSITYRGLYASGEYQIEGYVDILPTINQLDLATWLSVNQSNHLKICDV